MPAPGYSSETGTGLPTDILASTVGLKVITITIDTTARDSTNPVATTNLRRGLMLVPDAGVGDRYTELDAAVAGSAAVVVLAEDIYDIDNGNQLAKAYFAGAFKNGVLLDDSGTTLTHFTAANCQRIEIRDNL